MRKRIEKELLDRMHKDPSNWIGTFYFNKKDPRLTVPKINSLGWTFNFASPYTYVFLVLVIIIIVASQYLLK